MAFYAHSNSTQDKEQWQLLKNHLEAVAQLAAERAVKFNAKELGYLGAFYMM